MDRAALYDRLALLLAYPGADGLADARRAVTLLDGQARESLAGFLRQIEPLALAQLQELFIQSFDLNPKAALEVGWHLFGENYERGTFLVKMRQELHRLGLQETVELPDHLAHVLRVLGRLDDPVAAAFAHDFVLPALAAMRAGLEGLQTPFAAVLEAIELVLREQHPCPASQTEARAPGLRVLA